MINVINPAQIRTTITGKQILENIERGLAYPAGRHWSKAALSECDQKSSSEQAVLPDAAERDRRGKSVRIGGRSAA